MKPSHSTACAGLLLMFSLPVAAQQFCPAPPYPSGCLDMAVGEVSIQTLHPGQALCVQPGAAAQTLTVVPINRAAVPVEADFSASSLAPTVNVADGTVTIGLSLAALAEAPAEATPSAAEVAQAQAALKEINGLLSGPSRGEALLSDGRRTFPSAPPVVGDVLSIQVSPGCSGTPDLRLGRVMVASPEIPGQQRLYVLQEMTDPFTPAVPSTLTTADFESVATAYLEAFDPLANPLAFGSSTIRRAGAREIVENNFGEMQDLDGNGGVFVFFTRRLNEAIPPASGGFIGARFEARDLLSASVCPLSNEGEIIYMALPDPTGSVNGNVRTVALVAQQLIPQLTHQMTRLTLAGRRLYVQSAALEEPWLDEALAWMSSELLFYGSSVGLAPRNNIELSNLTTGPNASARVAAFNGFQNRIFSSLRAHYLLNTGATPAGRYSLFTPNPPSALVFETENERISYFYGATASFLRYALDRRNGDDAATLRSLVDTDLTGLANLESVFGADMQAWLHDFGVAMAADDFVPALAPEYRAPSWNYRSVYGGLGGYPLFPVAIPSGGASLATILGDGGGQRWLSFGVPAGVNGVDPAVTVQYSVGPTAPISPLKVAVVRTQ